MIHIGIAEDQALIRESLAIVLNLEYDLQVVWTATTGIEAIRRMEQTPADLILMDLRMPDMDGVAAIRRIRDSHPNALSIVLTTFHQEEWLMEAIHAGAKACLMKEVPPDLLISAIRSIVSRRWQPAEWSSEWRKYAPDIQFRVRTVAATVPPGGEMETLTGRDVDILRKLCLGATNKEIASELNLGEGTVKNYVSNLYAKLGVRHRAEAVKQARERGLW
ncbi:hypothetical protein A8709_18355 [Paenibacillus pectinilyticus]|uniref:DNA-binding response regulator n=1 Tax=Paenibacillus pectinilyticus TaxID=512399 RepID=A0A1C0ZZI2_9BACL|nr:response regulator transcription factor [Paenibacillus pectinilyticus]OCT13556.1 hypothetical protein A8709_18355 [Paenibacillus pectinilyticus]